MNFRNKSKYPTDEVRRLVLFGMQNLDHKGVSVTVVDYDDHDPEDRSGTRGLTEAFYDNDTGNYHSCDVYLGVGHEHFFPSDNIVNAENDPRYHGKPYGGKWECLIERQDWKEGLIHMAAHEGYHMQAAKVSQLENRPHTFAAEYAEEAEAEVYAKSVLDKYRQHGVRS